MFTVNQLIDTVEQIMRMERRLPGIRTSVREGADPARLHTLEFRIKELRNVLPETYSFADGIRMVAEHRIAHDDIVMEIQGLEKKIAEGLEAFKTQAWKFAGRKDGVKEPVDVVAARVKIAALDARLDTMDEAIQPTMRLLAAEQKAQDEMVDVATWADRMYTDPVPACILAQRADEQKAMIAGCERLKMPKVRSCIMVI
jgi:hypothetical protein